MSRGRASAENEVCPLARFSHVRGARVYEAAGISRFAHPDGTSAFCPRPGDVRIV